MTDDTAPLDEGAPAEPSPTRRRRWPLGSLTAIVLGFVAVGLVVSQAVGGGDPAPGSTTEGSNPPAPDFSIELIDGTNFRLSDHLAEDGRPVLLNLWASWCAPCRAEMPALDAAAAAHPEVFFLGVAVEDDPVAAADFADEIGVSYALAIDETDRVGSLYPSPGLPATFLIASDGTLVRTVYGGLDESDVDELIASL